MATSTSNPAQVLPGRGVGFLTLGASLHHVLTRLKSLPQLYPSLDLVYDSAKPVQEAVFIRLPVNGLRLRFDGPDQRLRLIEVLDFSKIPLVYKSHEVVKASKPADGQSSPGPSFRHIYNRLFGPSYPGEYIPAKLGDTRGTYLLSYPGVAFSFPLLHTAWSETRDFVSLMSSSSASAATSMVIFQGSSWTDARTNLFTRPPQNPRSTVLLGKNKESVADEVDLMKVHEGGRIELMRRSSNPFWIILGETTPQDIVTELGPPDAIYRKSDQRILIHGSRDQPTPNSHRTDMSPFQGATHTEFDNPSEHALTDGSDEDTSPTVTQDPSSLADACFYNYFHHGFDILISAPSPTERRSPGSPTREPSSTIGTPQLTAQKILFHGNVPGSYPFNRHRRCRWVLDVGLDEGILSSETPYEQISPILKDYWKDAYASAEEEADLQRGMVLNRGWGDMPGSVDTLGHWEGTGKHRRDADSETTDALGNTRLYGFPGLLFEVLKNDVVSCLTVY
ncbi:hypothetical protein FQN57_002616 [Myotisia sp. PD_48]|nr:hypothetical protein FQN57_002616 [Myotisia sp. PD_48]